MKNKNFWREHKGFSLVELLVALAMSGIVSLALYTSFTSQSRSYVKQEQIVEMQQNVRAAMDIMVRDIRMAGFCSQKEASFFSAVPVVAGGGSITTLDISGPGPNGQGQIRVSADAAVSNGSIDGREVVVYSVYDSTISPTGVMDLGRQENNAANPSTLNNRVPMIGYVEGLAFAYAFDADSDGQIDLNGGNIIWAVDTDADNALDKAVDTNSDGVIDLNDTLGGVALNTVGAPAIVQASAVRAVKIWLLVSSERQERNGFLDTKTYVLGERRFTPAIVGGVDQRLNQRRLLTETVWMRNAAIVGDL